MLTRSEFEVLIKVMNKDTKAITQRELSESLGFSLGKIHNAVTHLKQLGYVDNKTIITKEGIKALEPYRVKRAVIIAAGFGSRLVPITLNTPKPLVRVHGKRIIDTILDAIVEAEIPEVYIVRGYLSEQFDQLKNKYPMINFLENPLYNEANNISSTMCARHLMQNAYVIEADLLLSNPNLIKKYHYCSNFLGIPVERTDDWCFDVRDGIIKKQLVGGDQSELKKGARLCQMMGISYWDDEDGAKLYNHIREAYLRPGGKEYYWEQVPLNVFLSEYKVEVRECSFDDIIEIDTFRELKQIDPIYDV